MKIIDFIKSNEHVVIHEKPKLKEFDELDEDEPFYFYDFTNDKYYDIDFVKDELGKDCLDCECEHCCIMVHKDMPVRLCITNFIINECDASEVNEERLIKFYYYK